uniref:Type 2 C1q domain-containing protein 9 n=1 Tax=Littorina littorea TaxID=31216 RepID=A0A411DEN6_LITLI|nr:type 2 C1q domain-containing protein 9 [Littorina littorea]
MKAQVLILVFVTLTAKTTGKPRLLSTFQEASREDRSTDQSRRVGTYLQHALDDLANRVSALETKSAGQAVSFFAQFTEYHHGFAGDNTVLRFDNVISNAGNAYHVNTGHFVAPVAGTYAFYLNLLSDHDHTVWQNLCVMKNADCVALTQLADSASLSVVLELRSGDSVWAMKRDGPGTSIYGINHTTFSGMLVTASQ